MALILPTGCHCRSRPNDPPIHPRNAGTAGDGMIHYHGTPITPREQLRRMAGRNFCISYAAPQDLATCLEIGQALMFDNGAFSAFTRGAAFDEEGYYRWLEPILTPPHWAVIPDVIGGDEIQQWNLVRRWPFRRDLAAPVWHLGLSTAYLMRLLDEWPRVCFGSSEEYWNVGAPAWCGRMDDAFNEIAKRHQVMPWIHGLRMMGQSNGDWPLASADSTNVAQNFKRDTGCAECKARTIDKQQTPPGWNVRETQARLI